MKCLAIFHVFLIFTFALCTGSKEQKTHLYKWSCSDFISLYGPGYRIDTPSEHRTNDGKKSMAKWIIEDKIIIQITWMGQESGQVKYFDCELKQE